MKEGVHEMNGKQRRRSEKRTIRDPNIVSSNIRKERKEKNKGKVPKIMKLVPKGGIGDPKEVASPLQRPPPAFWLKVEKS